MKVISKARIIEFSGKYPESKCALTVWYSIVSRTVFRSLADLRKTFPSADLVGDFVVFNIGGNKYRLIAAIHYNRKMIFIRNILTHAEYNKNKWRKDK
jgi:mRNA interferase HigB